MKTTNRKNSWRRALTGWLIAVALVLGSVGFAQPSWAQEDKEETEVTAFTRKKEERKANPNTKTKPSYKAKIVEREFNLKAQQKRDETIRLLWDLVNSSDANDPDRPEYLFQLAEALWEKSKYFEQKAFKTQDEMYAARDAKDRGTESRLKQRMQDELQESTQQRVKATEVYVMIINDHDNYSKIADVYYFLGSNLIEIGKRAQALRIFRKLLQEYPNTEYTPRALLHFGEFAFDNDDMEGAMAAYAKVREFPDDKIYSYATYKLAWCHYNLTDYPKALETFLDVVKVTSKGKLKDESLRKEAMGDIVLTYSHFGKATKALPFFKKLVKTDKEVAFMGEKLAILYADSGQFEQSTRLFKKLIKLNKKSFDIVGYQLEIIRNVETKGDKVATVKEVFRAGELLKAANKFGDADPQKVKIMRERLELILREYATTYHREAQKTRDPNTYKLAHKLYEVYLQQFPESPDLYVMNFFYAELLYRLKKYDKAANAYESVINLDQKGRFNKQAVHAAVLSLQKLVEVEEKPPEQNIKIAKPGEKGGQEQVQSSGPGAPAPKTIPPTQDRLVKACDRYIAIAPDSRSIVKVKYSAARVLYDHYHFNEAIERFKKIVEDHSQHRLAVVAAELHLDSLYTQRNYKQLTDWVEVYRANEDLSDPEFKGRLDGIAERLQFQKCFDMEGEKKYEEAARCFTQDFYRNFPESDLVAKALYNAALDYERVRQIGKAIQVRKGLLQLRPEDELAPVTLYNIGGNYHAIAVYSKASEFYELYVQHFADVDKEKTEQALSSAATFRQGLGQYEEAIRNYEQYLQLFSKKKEQSAEVFFQIAKIYDDEKKTRRAMETYTSYIKKWGKSGKTDRLLEAHQRIGMIHYEARRYRKAQDAFKKVLSIYTGLRDAQKSELSSGADAAAQARFMIGEFKLREMEQIKLKLPESLLQKRLTAKLKAFQEAREIYFSVFKFSRPDWTLAALYRIGYVAQSLAEEIRNSPVPAGLSYEQEDIYKGGLEEKASAIDNGAIEAYEKCLSTALQASWFNEYSTKSEIALAGLQPKKYRKPSEIRAQPFNAREGFRSTSFLTKAVAEEGETRSNLGGGEEE